MSIEGLYNSSFSLYTNAITSVDSYGGVNRARVLAGTFPCYITALNGDEQVIYGKTNVVSTHMLFCSIIDMLSSDVVYVAGWGWFNVSFIDNANNMGHHLEVYLYQANAPQIQIEESTSSESSSSSSTSSSSSSSSSET